jgi:hypothetical protein
MFTRADLWAGLLLPAAVTAGLLIVACRATRRRMPARDSRSWAGPLATGAGFVAGYLALFGWVGLPPGDAVNWLFFLAPALALVGTVVACGRMALPGRLLLIALVVPLSLVLLSWPLLSAQGAASGELETRLSIAAALAIATVAGLDALSARISAARFDAILLAASAPAAIVLMLSGSQRLGQVGGILSATAAAALAAHLILGPAAVARGVGLVFATLLAGLLWCGNLYAELTTPDALILAVAPNLAWLAELLQEHLGRRGTLLAQGLIVLAVAGVAVARAWIEFAAEEF